MKSTPSTPSPKVNHLTSLKKFLWFSQGKSFFAIEITFVREVLKLEEQTITAVPNTLPFLLGLTNLRGEILAVADFGRLLGEEAVERHAEKSRILIVEAPNPKDIQLPPIKIGLAVSEVEGVLLLNPDDIVSAEEVSEEIARFLRGLYDERGRLLMIVDVEAIAQSERW